MRENLMSREGQRKGLGKLRITRPMKNQPNPNEFTNFKTTYRESPAISNIGKTVLDD